MNIRPIDHGVATRDLMDHDGYSTMSRYDTHGEERQRLANVVDQLACLMNVLP